MGVGLKGEKGKGINVSAIPIKKFMSSWIVIAYFVRSGPVKRFIAWIDQTDILDTNHLASPQDSKDSTIVQIHDYFFRIKNIISLFQLSDVVNEVVRDTEESESFSKEIPPVI